jgi:hypothetical protein
MGKNVLLSTSSRLALGPNQASSPMGIDGSVSGNKEAGADQGQELSRPVHSLHIQICSMKTFGE